MNPLLHPLQGESTTSSRLTEAVAHLAEEGLRGRRLPFGDSISVKESKGHKIVKAMKWQTSSTKYGKIGFAPTRCR